MNYQAVKEALQQCENYERYIKSLTALDRKTQTTISEHKENATYYLMKGLLAIVSWDAPEFGMYILPADILEKAIHEASERINNTVATKLADARKLVAEGFACDEIGRKKKT